MINIEGLYILIPITKIIIPILILIIFILLIIRWYFKNGFYA